MPGLPVKRFFGLVGAVLGAMATLAALATAAHASPAAVSRAVPQSPSEVRAYWTPERMRAAQPADLAVAPASPAPAAVPSGDATVIPPSSPARRRALQREAGSETTFPQSVHGRIFFNIPASGSHPEELASCSGTVVSSLPQNVVFTAGHCAQYPGEAPSTNMVFVPGYRDGSEPFGEFPVSALLTPPEWADAAPSYDFAIAELATPIERQLGARGIAFNKAPKTDYTIFGYPAEPAPTYDGERLIACDSSFLQLEYTGSHPFSTVAYPCDMGPGSSGGGWVNPAGDVMSVTSHGYEDPQLANQIVGPYFGDAAKRLYNAAGGSAQCPPAKKALKKAKHRLRKARRAAKRSSSRRSSRKLHRASKRVGKARDKRDTYC